MPRHSPGERGSVAPPPPLCLRAPQGTPGLCFLPTEPKVPVLPGWGHGRPDAGARSWPRSPERGDPAAARPVPVPCPGSSSRGSPEPWGAPVPRLQPPGVIRGQGMALLRLPPRLPSPFRGNPAPQPRRVLCSLLHVCAGGLGALEPRVRSEGAGQEALRPPLQGRKAPGPSLSSEVRDTQLFAARVFPTRPECALFVESSPLDELEGKSGEGGTLRRQGHQSKTGGFFSSEMEQLI